MKRTSTATIIGGLSIIATGGIGKLFTMFTNDVIPAFEDVLDDDWGAFSDPVIAAENFAAVPALVA